MQVRRAMLFGKLCVTACYDGGLRAWDEVTGRLAVTLAEHKHPLEGLQVTIITLRCYTDSCLYAIVLRREMVGS
jgi:hypothetical protein